MKKTSMTVPSLLLIFSVMAVLISLPLQGQALANSVSSEKNQTAEKDKDCNWGLYAKAGVAYTDNVYSLSDDQISDMEAPDEAVAANGRYEDMDSASDYILIPEIGIDFSSPGLLGENSPWPPLSNTITIPTIKKAAIPKGKPA